MTKMLLKLCRLAQKQELRLGELLVHLSEESQLIPVIVLALPFCLPIPLPGLSVPFGILICLVATMLLLGRNITVPHGLMDRALPRELLASVLRRCAKASYVVERLTSPRLAILNSLVLRKAYLIFILLSGALLALPLPPGTNFLPGLSIVLLALGKLRGDGICIVLGLLTFVMNAAVFGGLFALASSFIG